MLMKINIKVHLNSKAEKIEKDNQNVWQIYTKQKPIDGKANKEIIKMLGKYFKVKLNQVFIISGMKSRNKVIEIEND